MVLAAAWAMPASAQSTTALRAEIQAMQTRLNQLEAQQTQAAAEAAQARTAQQTIAQRLEQQRDLTGSFPRSIRLPGTETSVRLYGFVRLTASRDFEARNRGDVQSANSVPLTTGAASRQGGDFQFGGRRSRMGIETRSATAYGPARSVLEMDFAGAQSSGSTSSQNNWIPRLRHAYVEFAGFTMGQTTTLFGDTVGAEFLDSFTFTGLGGPRQAQIRYTAPMGGGTTFAIGLENPLSDFGHAGGTRVPDSDGSSPAVAINRMPDLTARVMNRGAWGHVALQGVLRRIDYTNEASTNANDRFKDEAWGYGVALNASVNVVGKSRVFGRVSYGEGAGRYFDILGPATTTNAGMAGVTARTASLDVVKTSAVTLGMQHFWTPTIRSSLVGGLARIDYPSYARDFAASTQNSQNRTITQVAANLVWSPISDLDVGLEYGYAQRSLVAPSTEGATRGRGQRLLAVATYRF